MNIMSKMFMLDSIHITRTTIICILIFAIVVYMLKVVYNKVKDKKVKCKYGYGTYTTYIVRLETKLKIEKYKLILKGRRLKRIGKRLCSYLKDIILVIIILILYSLTVYIIGKHNIDKEYYSIIDMLWEIKDTILTSIILTYFINANSLEKKRSENLLNRYFYYTEFMYSFQQIIVEICTHIGKEFEIETHYTPTMIAYTTESLDRVVLDVMKLSNNTRSKQLYIDNRNILNELFKNAENRTNHLRNELNKLYLKDYNGDLSLLQSDTANLIRKINNVSILLTKNNFKDNYEKFIILLWNIIASFGDVLSQLRNIWRNDLDIDIKIYKLLYFENIEYITQDYHISLLLDTKYKIKNNIEIF